MPEKNFLTIKKNTVVSCDEAAVSVTVPEGVTAIEQNAFAGCEKLREIALPSSLAEISNHAFSECISLREVFVPDGVTKIGFDAFDRCIGLTRLRLPPGALPKSGSFRFMIGNGYPSLCELTAPFAQLTCGIPQFSKVFPALKRLVLNGETPPGPLVPQLIRCFCLNTSGDTAALARLWAADAIEAEPALLAEIGALIRQNPAHFARAAGLPEARLLEKAGGPDPAEDTRALRDLRARFVVYTDRAAGVRRIVGLRAGVETAEAPPRAEGMPLVPEGYAFAFHPAVRELTLGEGLAALPDNLFIFAEELERIRILPGVGSIGKNTFYGCRALKSLTLPDGVTEIAENAFGECRMLERLRLPPTLRGDGDPYARFEHAFLDAMRELEAPLGFLMSTRPYLGRGFQNLRKLTVTAPPGETPSAADLARVFCLSSSDDFVLFALLLAEGGFRMPGVPGFEEAARRMLTHNAGMLAYALARSKQPEGARRMHALTALLRNPGLTMPRFVTEILLRVISDPESRALLLRNVSVTEPAFEEPAEPEGLLLLPDEAAGVCRVLGAAPGLTRFTLPETVCGLPVKLLPGAFRFHAELQQAVLPDTLPELPDELFFACRMLRAFTVPSGVRRIGRAAFRFTSLKRLRLPGAPEEICEYAFEECEALLYVMFPPGTRAIGSRAFAGCKRLRAVSLPDSLTEIADDAFDRHEDRYGLDPGIYEDWYETLRRVYANGGGEGPEDDSMPPPPAEDPALNDISYWPDPFDLALGRPAPDRSAFLVPRPVVFCPPESFARRWAEERGFSTAETQLLPRILRRIGWLPQDPVE